MNHPPSPTGAMAHNNFMDVSMRDSPVLVRRNSVTGRVLSVFDESEQELSHDQENESCSSNSSWSSFDFHSITNAIQQQLDEISEAASFRDELEISEEARQEARRQELRQRDVNCQKRHVAKNTRIILMDDEKFRQFKQAIKQTGMLTSIGVKQVLLSPTVDERRPCTTKSVLQ